MEKYNSMCKNLKNNQDISITTLDDYVIGYIVKIYQKNLYSIKDLDSHHGR